MYSIDFRVAVRSVYEHIQSMRRVSLILKVSSSTVHRWLREAYATRGWPRRGSKFTDAMVALIQLQLRVAPATTASQLQSLIHKQLGVNVSRQLVGLVLKRRLNMSWKRTRKRSFGTGVEAAGSCARASPRTGGPGRAGLPGGATRPAQPRPHAAPPAPARRASVRPEQPRGA